MVKMPIFMFLRHLYILAIDIIIWHVSDVANYGGHKIKIPWAVRINEKNTR